MTKQNTTQDSNNASPATMEEVLEYDHIVIPKIGEIVEGKVISKSSSEIHLDIDGITTGVVRGSELWDESGEYSNLKVGNKAQATVIELENENGELELSFRFAGHQKAWSRLQEYQAEGSVVSAEITEANKGGLIIQVGRVPGFLPVSQLTPEHYPRVEGGDRNKILERLQSYLGKSFKTKVIDVDEKEEKLIVSEKAAWEEAQKETLDKYKVGDRVDGEVTGVVDFGAFVEFGEGLEGLVHISELAWQRIDDPRDLISVGQKVKTEIISIDGSKISLSIKKLEEDPWVKVSKKYKVGQTVRGKIIKINPFGVFIELDRDIHGLAHISELSDKLVHNPSDIVKIGSSYDFKILSIEPENHRLGLSLKALKKEKEASVLKDEKAPLAEQGEQPDDKLKTKASEAEQKNLGDQTGPPEPAGQEKPGPEKKEKSASPAVKEIKKTAKADPESKVKPKKLS